MAEFSVTVVCVDDKVIDGGVEATTDEEELPPQPDKIKIKYTNITLKKNFIIYIGDEWNMVQNVYYILKIFLSDYFIKNKKMTAKKRVFLFIKFRIVE